jgi:26S proteasome regulatory subunit T4
MADPVREKALQDYRKKLLEHKEVESRLKESEFHVKNYNFKILTIFCF